MTANPGLSGRRTFLAALAAATAAGACKPRHGGTIAPAANDAGKAVTVSTPKAPGEITQQTIAEASKLFGVEYTDAERELALEGLEGLVTRSIKRREHELANSVAPATVFDPRLPGTELKLRNRVRATKKAPPLPSDPAAVAYAPASHLSRWIASNQITSATLTSLYLDRLEAQGPKLEHVVTLLREPAMKQAELADAEIRRGRRRGPLHGIPWGAKDLFDTAGTETAWGASPYKGRVPNKDAAVVQRLRDAGAVLIAKLTLGALAYGDIWYGGRTNNPWNTEEGSSGSSAGSAAATAAGGVGFSLGTETLGSIVSPCMRCGTTGLRPTFGRVPRTGAMALCWSLDKVGPICRTVEDCALVLDAISGRDAGDPGSITAPFEFDARRSIKGLRVGYDPKWFEGEGANDLDRKVLELARSLGVELVEIKIPELPYDALITILLAEAAAAFEDLTLSNRDDSLEWQDADAWPNTFRQSRFISAIDLVQADRLRREAMHVMAAQFANVEAMIGPSYAGPMLLVTNCTGHPSLTLRTGFTEKETRKRMAGDDAKVSSATVKKHRVPHGITVWGRLFDEGTLCNLGMAIERELDVWHERPPIG